jgi:hypothetical protein
MGARNSRRASGTDLVHASVLVNKCDLGHDGKIAHEMLKGKRATMIGLEFGEGVLFRKKQVREKLAKMECIWEHGIYLGHIVGTVDNVYKIRTVQRKLRGDKWLPENTKMVSGVQWRVSHDDPEQDWLI